MSKKIVCVGVALFMCLGLFSACGKKDSKINFTLALSKMDYGVNVSIEKQVNLLSEWTALGDITNLPELENKYDEQFFGKNALIVFAFKTPTMGGRIDEIKMSKMDNELLMEISGMLGVSDAISRGVVVAEVKKADISGVKSLKIVTDFLN